MLKRTLALGCLFAVLSLLVACGGGGGGGGGENPVATNTSSNGIVKGRIAGDGDLNGIPVYLVGVDANIPPASVRADSSPASGGNLYVAFTNASGEFEFANVPYGIYNLIAKKDRYNGVIQRNITVNGAIQSATDLILKLTATGDMSGTVQVPTDYPNLTGVVVFVTGTSYAAYTDERGSYTITGVPVGTYTVAFMATGLQQAKAGSIVVISGQTTTIPGMIMAKDANGFIGIT